jgi:hypothetical protein
MGWIRDPEKTYPRSRGKKRHRILDTETDCMQRIRIVIQV